MHKTKTPSVIFTSFTKTLQAISVVGKLTKTLKFITVVL